LGNTPDLGKKRRGKQGKKKTPSKLNSNVNENHWCTSKGGKGQQNGKKTVMAHSRLRD